MRGIVYYVSGHGFGHARRTAEVLRALVGMAGDVWVVVRTSAPAGLFVGIERVSVSAPGEAVDPGVVERDALTIDPTASMGRLGEFLARREAVVASEEAFVRGTGARLVVADVTFVAGDVAERAGVPCVAVGNFTWDWVYAGYAGAGEGWMVEEVARSYGRMRELMQLPLGHRVTSFRSVVQMPLVGCRARGDTREVLGRLGIGEADGRPRVLVAMRGGLSAEVLRGAAVASPDVMWVVVQDVPGATENLRRAPAELEFTDVLTACDAVVSKIGYGILADCMANGVAVLFPPRVGFAEDEISRVVCPRYLRMRELSPGDFSAGRWGEGVRALLGQARPAERMACDGDEAVARRVLGYLE